MTEINQLKLKIPDVYVVAQALEVAIKRKIFSEEEIQKMYAPWCNVIRFCDDIKRKTDIEELYRKQEEPEVPDLVESSTVVEESA